VVEVTWTQNAGQESVSWQVFDGPMLVGQVVKYDIPNAWVAFRGGHPVDRGPWATVDEAKAALERAVS
jgi:hypothetical protein